MRLGRCGSEADLRADPRSADRAEPAGREYAARVEDRYGSHRDGRTGRLARKRNQAVEDELRSMRQPARLGGDRRGVTGATYRRHPAAETERGAGLWAPPGGGARARCMPPANGSWEQLEQKPALGRLTGRQRRADPPHSARRRRDLTLTRARRLRTASGAPRADR